MTDERSWVAVAIIKGPHSLRGAVKLKALTNSDAELVESGRSKFVLRRRGRIEGEVTVTRWGQAGQGIIAYLEGVNDRNGAEALAGCEFVLAEEDLWAAPAGSYYYWQLQGLEVVDAESGVSYGKLLRVQDGAAHDLLVFPNPTAEGREVLLPNVPAFVKSVDLAAGRIAVVIPEGLLDL